MFDNMHSEFDILDGYQGTVLDVPYVPTAEAVVEKMLDLANVGPDDILCDLGSGDGRIVVAAARDRGARGFGIELDPLRIADAMEYAGCSHVEYLVDFIEEDIFSADISQASVVTIYLLQSVNLDLRDKLLNQLRPGARIVSHAFDMGDWKADDWIKMDGVTIYKWIVPDTVAGVWEWEGPDRKLYRIDLDQKYQQVTGNAWLDDRKLSIESATLQGEKLTIHLRDIKRSSVEKFTIHFSNGEVRSVVPAPHNICNS